MNKWLTVMASVIIIGVLIFPKTGAIVLKKITGKIEDIEDGINDQTQSVFEKIEDTAAAIHQYATK